MVSDILLSDGFPPFLHERISPILTDGVRSIPSDGFLFSESERCTDTGAESRWPVGDLVAFTEFGLERRVS